MTQQGLIEAEYQHIARRAYALYEARGCEHGHDVEDWLTAEAEIREEAQRSSAPAKRKTRQMASAA